MHVTVFAILSEDYKSPELLRDMVSWLVEQEAPRWDYYVILDPPYPRVADLTDALYPHNAYGVLCAYGFFGGDEYIPWNPEGERVLNRPLPPLGWLKDEFPDGVVVPLDVHL